MKKKKVSKVTNEDLLKQIQELKKIAEKNSQPVPYIPQQPVVIIKGHDHCTCWQCHPHYYPSYPIVYYSSLGRTTSGVAGTSMNTNSNLGSGLY